MKCLAPIIAYCMTNGIHIFSYLDNCMIQANSTEEIQKTLTFTLVCFHGLGLSQLSKVRLDPNKESVVSGSTVSHITAEGLSSIG